MVTVTILSLLLAAGAALAAPNTRSESTTARTPHGLRPIENTHLVPQGGQVKTVGSEVHLLDVDGTVLHVAQKDSSVKVKSSSTSSGLEPLETGWIAYASWYNEGDPIDYFNTTWFVPDTPAAWDGQTLFYFNSIEPASGDAILQPVLQYGPSAAGGGEYWAVASWYLVGSDTYYTSPIQVNPGDTLDGVITLTSTDGTNYDYVTSFSNIGGTSLTASNSAQLVWATETLEVYSVESLDDFPTGSTEFFDINISTTTGTPSMSWTCVSDTADGIDCTVTEDGPINAIITITY